MPKTAVRIGFTSFFRLWRLDINASDIDLEKSMEENDGRESWCARALIVGLVIEVIFAFWFRDGASLVRTWTPVIADILVAGGVLGEVHFASKISQAGAELRRRSTDRLADAVKTAGEANERAGRAELQAAEARERTAEIEKLTAWRRLSSESARAITESLRTKASQLVASVEYQTGDPESNMLALEISRSITEAGVNTVDLGANFHLKNTIFGTFVVMPPEEEDGEILDAFKAAGIWPISGQGVHFKMGSNGKLRNLYVWIGPKPPSPIKKAEASNQHA